jgi:hypothetical protein
MRTIFLLFLAAIVLAAPAAALADETPQTMAFELRTGPYQPNIDGEFSGETKPYDDIFDGESAWLFGAEVDVQLWHGFGSIGLFGNAAWGYVDGKGVAPEAAETSDTTSLSLVPLVFGGVYRFDVLAQRYNIPLVLSAKLGIDYTLWWIRDGLEEVTEFKDTDGGTSPGYGGTWGVHWALGLHFLLDVIEPHTAKVFDNEMGVNNSYLFAEYVGYWVDDFGSSKSFDLSHNGVVFGLAFEL